MFLETTSLTFYKIDCSNGQPFTFIKFYFFDVFSPFALSPSSCRIFCPIRAKRLIFFSLIFFSLAQNEKKKNQIFFEF